MYLAQIQTALAKADKTVRIDDDALELIVAAGYNVAFGARFLKRVIDERIKLPISARWRESTHFHVKVAGGQITVDDRSAGLVASDKTRAYGDVA